MKILILTGMVKKQDSGEFFLRFPQEIKEKTFCMPLYMDYLVQTGISKNVAEAFYDCLISVKGLAKTDKDLIIIGTAPKDITFDAVFKLDKEYDDKFIEALKELVKEDKHLTSYIDNLYQDSDSIMYIKNVQAGNNFIQEYLATDPHLEEIRKEYIKEVGKENVLFN